MLRQPRCHSLTWVAKVSAGSSRNHFVVEGWERAGAVVTLCYSGGGRTFREVFEFPVDVPSNSEVSGVIDLLAMVGAVSYAKALAPCEISASTIALTRAGRALVESAYGQGLAEFAHHTGISHPLRLAATLERDDAVSPSPMSPANNDGGGRPMVPLGGGRDSCVVAAALLHLDPILLSIGGSAAARAVAADLGRELVVVGRTIDSQIIEMNAAGAPNGHIPISAITMLASTVAAASLGAECVVMANEAAASNPTRMVNGHPVNHQHSKSAEFETLLVAALSSVGSPTQCVSGLRNRSDTEIARVFAHRCTALHADFVSCNRTGVRDPQRRAARWCGECPKCRSIYLSLAPHMAPADLSAIFGRDLLADVNEVAGFADLCDEERKPFECVQTVDEARASIGILAASATWGDHQVVRALAHLGGSIPATTTLALGDHVPSRVREAMEAFFS